MGQNSTAVTEDWVPVKKTDLMRIVSLLSRQENQTKTSRKLVVGGNQTN